MLQVVFVMLQEVFSSKKQIEEDEEYVPVKEPERDRPKTMCGFVNQDDDIPPVHHKLTLRMLEGMPKAAAQQALGERLWVKLNTLWSDTVGVKNGQIVDELFLLYGYPELLKFLKSGRGLKRAAEIARPILDQKLDKQKNNLITEIAWQWMNPRRYAVCQVDIVKDRVAAAKTRAKLEMEEKERTRRKIAAELLEAKGLKNDTYLSDAMEDEIEEKLKIREKKKLNGRDVENNLLRTLKDGISKVGPVEQKLEEKIDLQAGLDTLKEDCTSEMCNVT